MTLLVLRPEPQASRMVADLGARGVAAVAAPMLEIVAEPMPARRVTDAAGEAVILSSPQAARILGRDLEATGLLGLPAVAVGPGTAAAAREAGFATVFEAGGDADELVARVLGLPYRRLVHAVGRDRVGDVAGRIEASGRAVVVVEIYRAEAARLLPKDIAGGLGKGAFSGIVVGSARTAAAFRAAIIRDVGLAALARLGLVAMSEAAAAPLAGDCAETVVAARPDAAALTEAAIALAARLDQTGSRPTGSHA